MTSPFLVNGVMCAMGGRADRFPMRINWKTQQETQHGHSAEDSLRRAELNDPRWNWLAAMSVKLAEREGFEPSVGLLLHMISNHAR